MMTAMETPRFKGEISAQDDLRTNAKGGSFAAILKKRLATALGLADAPGGQTQILAAATVEIDSAHRLLLMTAKESFGTTIQVRRTGKHSVELSVLEEETDEIDEVAASFVEFKKKLFARGRLNLTAPMDADAFEALADHALAEAQARHRAG
ncbi:hypothetical protein D0Z66_20340 (plasmid) [Cereibacter sphaeroides]|nr:hypothetical protein D0Z66_20340 [Cereibacter sphaeroides]